LEEVLVRIRTSHTSIGFVLDIERTRNFL